MRHFAAVAGKLLGRGIAIAIGVTVCIASPRAQTQSVVSRVEASNEALKRYQRAVADNLRDPESAQFRNLYVVRDSEGKLGLCGEVNGRNAFGAYAGFTTFYAALVELEESARAVALMWWPREVGFDAVARACGQRTAAEIQEEQRREAEVRAREALAAATAAATEKRYTAEELSSTCALLGSITFDPRTLSCRVESVTTLGSGILLQHQQWDPSGPPRWAMVVLAATEERGSYRRVLDAAVEGYLENPRFEVGGERDFISFRHSYGGNSGAGEYLVWQRPRETNTWSRIDTASWRNGLRSRVPHNVDFYARDTLDLRTMTATVPVYRRDRPYNQWRDDGYAEIRLTLHDNVLIISSVAMRPPARSPRQRVR